MATIFGSSESETIYSGVLADSVYAFLGDDWVSGRGGDDRGLGRQRQ